LNWDGENVYSEENNPPISCINSYFVEVIYFTVFNANFLCVCVSSTKYTSPDAPLPKFDFFSNV
jgi:hypothetical protein